MHRPHILTGSARPRMYAAWIEASNMSSEAFDDMLRRRWVIWPIVIAFGSLLVCCCVMSFLQPPQTVEAAAFRTTMWGAAVLTFIVLLVLTAVVVWYCSTWKYLIFLDDWKKLCQFTLMVHPESYGRDQVDRSAAKVCNILYNNNHPDIDEAIRIYRTFGIRLPDLSSMD